MHLPQRTGPTAAALNCRVMRIAILTAGGAGMFCGSCMHDNTLAKALIAAGHDCVLVPCYTPIRVDEADASGGRVFLGGINLYLDHRFPWTRRLPRLVKRALNSRGLLRQLSRLQSSSDARELGDLTVAMLRGADGPLASELPPLVEFLTREFRPDAVLFSNALMAGVLPSLRAAYDGPVSCLLQGDDVFLDGLPARRREAAVSLMASEPLRFDSYLSHTRFYADYMAGYLNLPRDRIDVVPLGIDVDSFPVGPHRPGGRTVGYFARLAPEKGLHQLVDAYLTIADRGVSLRIGGFIHAKDRKYAERQFARLDGTDWTYAGSPPSHEEKVAFYHAADVVSVPTAFLEPKGLPVLEAIACGRPVVQPAHGAFPEIIQATGGGLLFPPGDTRQLAEGLLRLLDNPAERHAIATAARQRAIESIDARHSVAQTVSAIRGGTER